MANVGLILGIVLPISITILSLVMYVFVEYCIRKGQRDAMAFQQQIYAGRVPQQPNVIAAPVLNDQIFKMPTPAYGKTVTSWTTSQTSSTNPSYPLTPPVYHTNTEYNVPQRA